MIAFLSTWEIVAVLVVALLLFGHRLPGMARSLGSGITEFKRGLKDGQKPDGGGGPSSGGAGSSPGGAGQSPTRHDDTSNTGAPR